MKFRTKGFKFEPLWLRLARDFMAVVYVLIFSFFVYVDAYVEQYTPTHQVLVDEIRADFIEQLK